MGSRSPDEIFKVMPRSDWQTALAEGVYRGSEVDLADGFIHFSTASQLATTIEKHFAGQKDLVCLTVRATDLGDRLVYEPSRGGDLFPHLYGDLPLDAVTQSGELSDDR